MVSDDDLTELYKVLQLRGNLIYRSHLFFKLAEAEVRDVDTLLQNRTPKIETRHGGP